MTIATENLTSIADDLELIVQAAQAAGEIALPYFVGDIDLDVQLKGGNSPVSAADYAVNEYLHKTLRKARPDYGWLSEETEDDDQERRVNAQRTFVVDPIDGTRGFIEGRDMWCVSIAVVESGVAIAGVLFCPARGELYTAGVKIGAALNGQKISIPSPIDDEKTIGGPRIFLDVMDVKSDAVFIRHPHVPSLAYRIALVATGKMQATFIKPNAHDWDIAAAGLILTEAGGRLCDKNGLALQLNQASPVKPVIVATHPLLEDEMLAIVQETPFG